jgi:hypothetical protein
MKIIILLTIILLNYLSAETESNTWKYKKWEVSNKNNLIRSITHGQMVWGHEFGIIRSKQKCNQNLLWLTWSTYEKNLEKYKGKEVEFLIKIDKTSFNIKADIKTVFQFSSLMDVALFTNFVINDNFINLLKKGSTMEISIVSPQEIAKQFDIKNEIFSLDGFVANYIKSIEACKDPKVLLIPPKKIPKPKKVIKKYTVKNIISNHKNCDSINTVDNINFIPKYYEKYGNAIAIGDNYLFYGDGRDGGDKYPDIKIVNICNPKDIKEVTSISDTDEQLFSVKYNNGLLFTQSSPPYDEYDTDSTNGYFRIIDVKNPNNIQTLYKTKLKDTIVEFAVDNDYVYLLEKSNLVILNIKDKKNPIIESGINIKLDNYSPDYVTVDKDNIYITGNRNLVILNKQTHQVLSNIKYPEFRTSNIIVDNKIAYIRGWNNGDKFKGIVAIDVSNPKEQKLLHKDSKYKYIYEMIKYYNYIYLDNGKKKMIPLSLLKKSSGISTHKPTKQPTSKEIKAFETMKKFCDDKGRAESCHILGRVHRNNKALYSEKKAIEYFNKACNLGFDDSCKLLKSVYPNFIDKNMVVKIKTYDNSLYIDKDPNTYTIDDDTHRDCFFPIADCDAKLRDNKTNKPVTHVFITYNNDNKKSGIYQKIEYVDGKYISIKVYYKSGLLETENYANGNTKYYYSSGKLKGEEYRENKKTIINFYYRNGNLKYNVVKNWKAPKYKIVKTIYYKSGEKKVIMKFNKQKRIHGRLEEFYKNGNLKVLAIFENGKAISGKNFTAEGVSMNFTRAHIYNTNLKFKDVKYKGYKEI